MKNIIHKAGGVIIVDGKLLVERSKGKDHFIAPGGTVEANETATQALVRELSEEFGLVVQESDLEPFDTFTAEAADRVDTTVIMDVFIVQTWKGNPTPQSEIEEIRWLGKNLLPAFRSARSFYTM